MLSPRHFGRGRISAAAAAAVVIATPAAIAAVPDAVASFLAARAGPATAKAPGAADADADAEAGPPAPGTPIKTGLLKLDVAAAPVDGAVRLEAGGVGLKVRSGGRIAHGDRKLLGGKVLLDGGVRLANGERTVVVKDFAVDLRTHVVTAKAAGRDVRLGVLNDATARLLPHTVRDDANIAIGGRLVPDAQARADVADVFAGAANAGNAGGAGIGATLEANTNLDVDLAYALGLNDELGLVPHPEQ